MSLRDIETLRKWSERHAADEDTPAVERVLWVQIAAEAGRYLDVEGDSAGDGPSQVESLFGG